MNTLKVTQKACIALLAVLLVWLALPFIPVAEERALSFAPVIDAEGKISPEAARQIAEAAFEGKADVRVIVKSTEDAAAAVKQADGRVRGEADVGALKFASIDIRPDKVEQLAASSAVEKIYPILTYYPTLEESVPLTNARLFWDAGYKGTGITIAVLDTGIDQSHPMLTGRVVASRDFSGSGSADDVSGHGTHVAGTIAGTTAHGGRYDGVAPEAQLLNAKVIGDDNTGRTDSIITAIGWAIANDADVISMSLGAPTSLDPGLEEAIQAAVAHGIVVVASSGNCGNGCPTGNCGSFRGVTSPGSSPHVISVGAINDDKQLACFSSGEVIDGVGIKPDIVAPGVDVISAVPGGSYGSKRGTSMAAPHVSGSVALLLQKKPDLTPADVQHILEATALDLGASGEDANFGSGMLDLSGALNFYSDIEFIVAFDDELVSGNSQHIVVEVFDDIPVTEVSGEITKPDGSALPFTFTNTAKGAYAYDYADTSAPGSYNLKVSIRYQTTLPTSENPAPEQRTAFHTQRFTVTLPAGNTGSIASINVAGQQFYSSNLTGSVDFRNTGQADLDVALLLQLIADGQVAQEMRTATTTSAPGVTSTIPFNHELTTQPGDYTLLILADYGTGSVANETGITVTDDLPPQVHLSYAGTNDSLSPQLLLATVKEHSDLASVTLRMQTHVPPCAGELCTLEGATVVDSLNYTITETAQSYPERTLAVTAYANLRTYGHMFEARLETCDTTGNCVQSDRVLFNTTDCNGHRLALVQYGDASSAFERAAAEKPDVCVSPINLLTGGTPPLAYLHHFNALVWTEGTSLAGIRDRDAQLLQDYYESNGRIIAEGSEIAFSHRNDELMRDVLHAELNSDVSFGLTSAESGTTSINVTRQYPIFDGLPAQLPFNATVDPFPDAISGYNGSVELATWHGNAANGSAMTVYEANGKKVLFLPFSIAALDGTIRHRLAAQSLDWLLDDASLDITPAGLEHDFLVEGALDLAAIVESTENMLSPSIQIFVDGTAIDSGAPSPPVDIAVSDDFNDGSIDASLWLDNGWNGGELTESNGVLRFSTGSSSDRQVRTLQDLNTYDNFILEFSINVAYVSPDKNQGFWLGNLAEGQPSESSGHRGYYWQFHGKTGGFNIGIRHDGNGVGLHDKYDAPAYSPDSWHAIKIEKAGNAISFYFDGALVGYDNEYINSMDGLFWLTGRTWKDPRSGENADIRIDDFQLYATTSNNDNGLSLQSSGETQQTRHAYPFATELDAGLHTVTLVANERFSIKEQNYVNNMQDYSLRVYPKKSDLLFSGFAYTYDASAEKLILDLNVSNMGGTTADALLSVSLDGAASGQEQLTLLKGETKQASLMLPSVTGVRDFVAVLDPDGAVDEHNETNNALQETIYLCSKQKILVVNDNDAGFASTAEPESAAFFFDILQTAGYCAELWDVAQRGRPSPEHANIFPVLIWSSGDYFGNLAGTDDEALLTGYTGSLLLEGSDLAMELPSSAFMVLSGGTFLHDLLIETAHLQLSEHPLTAGIADLTIDPDHSPYPDSIAASPGDTVAEWETGNAAITARTRDTARTAYYGFSVDAVTDHAVRETLILNTVRWLLEKPNRAPTLTAAGDFKEVGATMQMNEGETKTLSVIAADPDGDEITYLWQLNGETVSTTDTLTFAPQHDASGTYTLTIIVSDGEREAQAAFTIIVLDTLACGQGQTRSCPLQLGICSGAVETCTDGQWPGCDAFAYGSNYEESEASCDGLDNDCDGGIDENFDDYDRDATADCVDADMDGDGIENSHDDFVGHENDIILKGEEKRLQLRLDLLSGTRKKVMLQNQDRPLLEFEHDFDKEKIRLRGLAIEKQGKSSNKGYTIVRGLHLKEGTKSVFVDRLSAGSNAVCVKDAEVSSFTEVSAACDADGEQLLLCTGVPSVQTPSCTLHDATGQFLVTGLKHSAVLEQCADADEDGYLPEGCPQGLDCNDGDAAIHPGATELCNGIDDNCDGYLDEDLTKQLACGFNGVQSFACVAGAWAAASACADNGVCHPGTVETRPCGTTDVGICSYGTQSRLCSAGYAWGDWSVCTGSVEPVAELCDGLDNDCDGGTDEGFADMDGDRIADCVDDDVDGDGVMNGDDRLEGDAAHIETSLPDLQIEVRDTAGTLVNPTEKAMVHIKENGKNVVDFAFDFSQRTLQLQTVMIEKQPQAAATGYTIVRGLHGIDGTKTVYVNQLNPHIGSVCIKDADITSVQEVSNACTGTDELLLMCDGSAVNGYACSAEESAYKVSGLKHSGVLEMCSGITEICNDGTDNNCNGDADEGCLADLTPTTITCFSYASPIKAGMWVACDSGIANTGVQDTHRRFNVKWYLDGQEVGFGGHTLVPAGETVMDDNSHYLWPSAVAGEHTIRFEVNAHLKGSPDKKAITESDYGNNVAEVTVTVVN